MEPGVRIIMVDDHNPDITESKPLNTEIETLAPEATADSPPVIRIHPHPDL